MQNRNINDALYYFNVWRKIKNAIDVYFSGESD